MIGSTHGLAQLAPPSFDGAEEFSPPPGLRRSSSTSTMSWTEVSCPATPKGLPEGCHDTLIANLEGFGSASIAPNLLSIEHSPGISVVSHEHPHQTHAAHQILQVGGVHPHLIKDEEQDENTVPRGEPERSPYDDASNGFSSSPLTLASSRYLQPHDYSLSSPSGPLSVTDGNVDRIFGTHRFYEDSSDCKPPIFEFAHPFAPRPNDTSGHDAAMAAIQCVLPDQSSQYCDIQDLSDRECLPSSSPSMDHKNSCGFSSSTGSSSPFSTPARRRRAKSKSATLPLVVSSTDKPHLCPKKGCDKRFRRQEHLRRHERTHTQDRPYECEVPKCRKQFSRSDNLRAHRRTHLRQGGRNLHVPDLRI